MNYDVIIPVAAKDISFVPRVIKYIRKNLYGVDNIYIITNKSNFSKTLLKNHDCILLDEDSLLPGLYFLKTKELLEKLNKNISVGWYFQQFLKYAFGLSEYATKYYLSWDADTLPLREIRFFDQKEKPLFTKKYEYNENYFITIKKLLNIKRQVEFSFIAEHMLFDPAIIKELITKIEESSVFGNCWYEKIINAGNYEINFFTFSEFETYGNYVMVFYPDKYSFRQLNTFRRGGYIQGRNISDEKLIRIGFDTDTISFELQDEPLFPYNILLRWTAKLNYVKELYHRYGLISVIKRLFCYQMRKLSRNHDNS